MADKLDSKDIYYVLVRPNFLGNIGAVARVCKNFGFANLRLVNAPKNYKDAEARKMAVGAFDLLKSAQTFNSLGEALADMNLVVGTTAGQQRSLQLLPLTSAIDKMQASSGNRIAIVLGDERDGLTNDEISLCHILTRIETDKSFPSMNVAQAASVIAYAVSRACAANSLDNDARTMNAAQASDETVRTGPLPTGKSNDELFVLIDKLLDRIEFSRSFSKQVVTKELRRFYYKATPTKREAELLTGALHKINQALASADPKSDHRQD